MTKCLNPKKFVRNLFETFNIEPNQKYAEAWNSVFVVFEDAVIDEAWLELVGECKMKYLCDTKTAYRILSATRKRVSTQRRSDEFHKTAKNTSLAPGFRKFYLAVEEAKEAARAAMGNKKGYDMNVYWSRMADYWDSEGDKNAAFNHRRRIK
jgi:hypothetical protein